MNKAVFFDRDGVINCDEGHYYVYQPAQFKLNANIVANIATLYKAGYLIIIISNQGGIGKSIYTISDSDMLHQILKEKVKAAQAQIAEVYFCPHHPDSGNCICRKPNSLLIEKAIARFNINIAQSVLIGDSKRDIEAAQAVGLKGYLVPKNTDISNIVEQIIIGS